LHLKGGESVIRKLSSFATWSTRRKVILIVGVVLCIALGVPLLFRLSSTFTRENKVDAPISNTTGSSNVSNTTGNSNKDLIAWPAFDGGGQRSGINAAETTITASNVGQLTRLWHQKLPATADGAPVELPDVSTGYGVKTLLFVITTTGSLLAIDAADGRLVWRKDTSGPKFTTSSPALDPSGKFVYSYGLDGKVHKYAVSDGEEATDQTWPAVVTVMPIDEKGSSPINIANGYLYMAIAGYPGDGGHYEGHIVAINLASGKKTVFNALCANIQHVLGRSDCADVQSAIWGRGAPTVDPVTDNVFVSTGNGAFRGDGRSFGDSIIELSSDLTRVVDSYTPAIFNQLQALDQDLGSTAPTILPKQANSKTPYLMVQAGKDNMLRLVNRQNLSGQGGPNHTGGEVQTIQLPIKGVIVTHPVAWNDVHGTTWVFVANTYYFFAYKVVTDAQGKTGLQLAYQNKNGGSSPFIANNVLFVQGKGVVRAMNPTTGAVLWSSAQASAGGSTGKMHWQSPIVVNGHVYVPDDSGYFSAYGLK
jgi:outer membrane protein assembly factor BamB